MALQYLLVSPDSTMDNDEDKSGGRVDDVEVGYLKLELDTAKIAHRTPPSSPKAWRQLLGIRLTSVLILVQSR